MASKAGQKNEGYRRSSVSCRQTTDNKPTAARQRCAPIVSSHHPWIATAAYHSLIILFCAVRLSGAAL